MNFSFLAVPIELILMPRELIVILIKMKFKLKFPALINEILLSNYLLLALFKQLTLKITCNFVWMQKLCKFFYFTFKDIWTFDIFS